jgi:hypothetical protein
VTQIGQEPAPVGQAASPRDPVRPGPGVRVRVEAGTLMQKRVPPRLAEPYLTGQRSVITGFVHRAQDAELPDPPWLRPAHGGGDPLAGPDEDAAAAWVLRWRALEIHTYLAVSPTAAGAGRPFFELFMAPGPVPVGTEMYRITPAGGQLIARHDGRAWVPPGPGPRG